MGSYLVFNGHDGGLQDGQASQIFNRQCALSGGKLLYRLQSSSRQLGEKLVNWFA
jgi:hypothetical protein